MFDTHCHLTFKDLASRIDQVVSRAAAAGVHGMITVGTSPDDGIAAVKIAERLETVYAAVGLHPHYAAGCIDRQELAESMGTLGVHPKVVALGEMGLDNHYDDPPMSVQRRAFGWQLDIAAETDLPIIIHNREATDDTIRLIRDSNVAGERFVFHCFTGDDRELDAVLALGAMVSFTGIITFKNARSLAACAARVPIDRLMIETDSPYLTPEPHRKIRPNEPCYVPLVATFLAAARKMEKTEFIQAVDDNARRFFFESKKAIP